MNDELQINLNSLCITMDIAGLNLHQCKEALTKGMNESDKIQWMNKIDDWFYTYIKPIEAYSNYDQLIDFPKRQVQHTF
jgi:hypothetical protein